jgi:hypothetical protein
MKTMAQKLEDRPEGNFQDLGDPMSDMAGRMGPQMGPPYSRPGCNYWPSSGSTPTLIGALH